MDVADISDSIMRDGWTYGCSGWSYGISGAEGCSHYAYVVDVADGHIRHSMYYTSTVNDGFNFIRRKTFESQIKDLHIQLLVTLVHLPHKVKH